MGNNSIFSNKDYNSPFGNWLPPNISDFEGGENKIDIYVTKLEGPTVVCEGTIFEFRITKFNTNNFILGEIISHINWAYSVDGKKLILINQQGVGVAGKQEVFLKWKIPKLNNGTYLKVYAWINKQSDNVCTSATILNYPFLFDKYKEKGLDQQALNIADDMCYGDGVNKTDHFKYPLAEIEALGYLMKDITMKSPTQSLWSDLKLMVGTLFTSLFYQDLRKTALSMVDRFKTNAGGIFTSDILNNEVLKHESTKEFCKNIEIGLQTKLKQFKGNLPYLFDDFIYKNSNRYDRPAFHNKGDISTGLTIMINDTWAYEVLISGFNTNDGVNYNIKYKVILYDHFGLDIPDLRNHPDYYALAGFRAWFVLQHIKNYKPFITKIEFEKSFVGNINNVKK